jgi:hypothetical protein
LKGVGWMVRVVGFVSGGFLLGDLGGSGPCAIVRLVARVDSVPWDYRRMIMQMKGDTNRVEDCKGLLREEKERVKMRIKLLSNQSYRSM